MKQGEKPAWWPECPWPKSIWTMTIDEYVKAVPEPNLRTAISGSLMREGWEMAIRAILEASVAHEHEIRQCMKEYEERNKK